MPPLSWSAKSKRYDVTLHLHCHATTGMAEMALLKAIEAGVDGVDTAISSMSATYGHPATEALVPPSPARRTTPASYPQAGEHRGLLPRGA